MPAKVFLAGETAYGKWPGSAMYYKGEIIEYNPVEKEYKLKFENDDSETLVASKDVYHLGYFKPNSPARRRRSRSPGRRRSRSKSPARKSTTNDSPPSRRKSFPSPRKSSRKASPSPTRNPRSTVRVTTRKVVEDSPTGNVKRVSSEKSAVIVTDVVETISHAPKVDNIKPRSRLRQSKVVVDSLDTAVREEKVVTRRMSTRSVTRAAEKHAEIQNESDNEAKQKCCSTKVVCSTFCSLVSFVAYSAMIVFPFLMLSALYLTCKSKNICTFLKRPIIPDYKKWFSWRSTSYIFGWFIFQAILAALPIGKIVSGPVLSDKSRKKHRLNGMASLIISLVTFAVLYHCKRIPIKFLYVNYLSLLTATCIFTLVVSVVVFILSRYAEESEPSGGIYKDFVIGRIVHPELCGFNIKTYGFKTALITWGVMNLIYLAREYEKNGWSNKSLVILVMLHMLYIFDAMFFEESFLYSASLSSEKIGLAVLSIMFPFIFFTSTQGRYLTLYPLSLPWYCYLLPMITHTVGYCIYRISTLQKFMFRSDPENVKLSGLDYIKTDTGKDILVGGWWGRLRHPNYFGDLLMCFSWAGVCGVKHLLPWLWPALLTVMLIGMAKRDDQKCHAKYGLSWEKYQRRVKYKVFPFIY